MKQVLETPRLIHRELVPEDAESLFRVYHEPDVLKYFVQGPPASVEEERAGIIRHLGHYARHGFGLWATVLRDSGEVIGRCGLLAQAVDGVEETEVAYLLSPRFWGRGLASEAARAVRDLAFQELRLPRLVSIIHPQNLASKRVAIALGMKLSKTTRLPGLDAEVFSMPRPMSQA
ncbi:MAG: GNAT family N-acetyltransferase [Prosthecobacter sp.]